MSAAQKGDGNDEDKVNLVDTILADEAVKRNKDNTDTQANEELFKHLSYLSQIRNDADKDSTLQQEAGPGEYKIKLFDSSSASPSSAATKTPKRATSNVRPMSSNIAFDLEKFDKQDESTGKKQRPPTSRISMHLNKMNSFDFGVTEPSLRQ